MSVRGARWRNYATVVVVTGVVVAGCSSQPAVPRGSATSCYQFGVEAIQRHVTVTTVPAACQGLSQLEVNVAVDRALQAAAAGVRGKARQRQLIGRDSPYLADLIHAVPAPGRPTVAAPQSGPPSRGALGLAALAAWLVTVGLGVSMMARWITRTRRHGVQLSRGRGPVLNFTHDRSPPIRHLDRSPLRGGGRVQQRAGECQVEGVPPADAARDADAAARA